MFQLFDDMKNGKFDEGQATLRMKITLEEGKQVRYIMDKLVENRHILVD